MPITFKVGHNTSKSTKNICCMKDETAVDHSMVTRWFKEVCLGCKKLGNQARSGRPKTMDPEAMLQATDRGKCDK